MTTNFPTSLDTLTNPTATDQVATVDHAAQHANVNDGVEALQAKVGIDGSAVTTSHDYKLGGVTGSDKAASLTGTETLTNKTLTTPTVNTPTITTPSISNATITGTNSAANLTMTGTTAIDLGSDATGDTYYRDSGGDVERLGIGSAGQILTVSGGLPTWSDATGVDAASVVDSIDLQYYSVTQDPFPVFQDDSAKIAVSAETILYLDLAGQSLQVYDLTNIWADADEVDGVALVGAYVYVLLRDGDPATDVYRVYRLDKTDITSSSQMTFSGQSLTATNSNVSMMSNGTDFYFTFDSGNSANDYDIAKFTVSGTTFTYDSTITCGSTAGYFIGVTAVDASENIYTWENSGRTIKKYNSSGTLQDTSDAYRSITNGFLGWLNWNDNHFIREEVGTTENKYVRIYVA